jgi:rhodanese-related sulfurtransferase
MKTNKILYFLLIAAFAIFIVGCEKDEEVDQFDELTSYMEENGLDLPEMLTSWTITAATINGNPAGYFIMDIRSADTYNTGHIPGAHNVSLADVVQYEADNNNGALPVVVTCYTGHSAGHAVMALRLSGVTTAKSLVWGMSSWHSDFNSWDSKIGNKADDYPGSWVEGDAPPALPSYSTSPNLDTGLEDGAAILDYQLENYVLDGLNGVNNTDVLASPESYNIYNYWAESDWDKYGHIDGAYQVTPGTFGLDNLDILDRDATNVFYCWSGQTASLIAAWLNALGYDAQTLKFSANGMIYDKLEGHKWGVNATPGEFNYVTN